MSGLGDRPVPTRAEDLDLMALDGPSDLQLRAGLSEGARFTDAFDGSASTPGAMGHRIYPGCSRLGLTVAADITYIPSRASGWPSWTGTADRCWPGSSPIGWRRWRKHCNSDQGAQFTSEAFTQMLQEQGVRVSRMVRVGTWTTSSWSGCGGASSTRRCI